MRPRKGMVLTWGVKLFAFRRRCIRKPRSFLRKACRRAEILDHFCSVPYLFFPHASRRLKIPRTSDEDFETTSGMGCRMTDGLSHYGRVCPSHRTLRTVIMPIGQVQCTISNTSHLYEGNKIVSSHTWSSSITLGLFCGQNLRDAEAMSLVCNANVVAMFRMVERPRSVRVMIGIDRSYSDRGGMIMIDKGHGNLSLVGQDDDNNPSLCNTSHT